MMALRSLVTAFITVSPLMAVNTGLIAPAAAQAADYQALCSGSGITPATPATVIEGCTKVIEIGPDGPALAAAYNNRAFAFRYNREYDRAIQDYNEAVRLRPNWAIPYNNRGVTYRRKREYDKAIKDYTQAIGLDSSYVAAYYNRAVAFLESGRFDSARADFDQVLFFNSQNALALYGRGLAKMKAGDIAGGNADMTAALRINQNVRAEFEPGD